MTREEKKAELMALYVAGHAAVDAKIAVETTKFYGLEGFALELASEADL